MVYAKKLQWFKLNDEIPADAVFIKAEQVEVGTKEIDLSVFEEQYLYEVPLYKPLSSRPPR
jgi:hypothetical protein